MIAFRREVALVRSQSPAVLNGFLKRGRGLSDSRHRPHLGQRGQVVPWKHRPSRYHAVIIDTGTSFVIDDAGSARESSWDARIFAAGFRSTTVIASRSANNEVAADADAVNETAGRLSLSGTGANCHTVHQM